MANIGQSDTWSLLLNGRTNKNKNSKKRESGCRLYSQSIVYPSPSSQVKGYIHKRHGYETLFLRLRYSELIHIFKYIYCFSINLVQVVLMSHFFRLTNIAAHPDGSVLRESAESYWHIIFPKSAKNKIKIWVLLMRLAGRCVQWDTFIAVRVYVLSSSWGLYGGGGLSDRGSVNHKQSMSNQTNTMEMACTSGDTIGWE